MSRAQALVTRTTRPRRQRFDFDAIADRHWCGGDPFRTRFLDAFSTLLPIGERFFIAALRRSGGRITDPQLVAVHPRLDLSRNELGGWLDQSVDALIRSPLAPRAPTT